ncbi:uncharacterized protein [Fopius arisanus]|uniref:Uncharacterized protein n=1 Tax=Fopius arisanus TaxID=64838 RepID=A0A9R1TP68_9HYME|nr:PREDICTED: uncharacterized protein LOC105272386 [Fopius arisanus]
MYYVWGKPSISRPTQTRPTQQPTTSARKREKCKRKRQNLVWSPEEEVWHEPYMVCLHKQFSDPSIRCDSTLELPWKDIALPLSGMRIRPEVRMSLTADDDAKDTEEVEELEKKESTGRMELPWHNLLVADMTPQMSPDVGGCDSTVEIPWGQLTFEEPPQIKPPPVERTCSGDDIEVPWNDIMVPQNIIIAGKTRKHPSNLIKRRPGGSDKCQPCNRCSKEQKSNRKLPVSVLKCPGAKR